MRIQMSQTISAGKLRASIFAALALLVCVTGLVAADQSQAQLPSICEQYPDRDICIGPVDDADENGNDAVDPTGAGDGDGTGDADGSLPFTGYPLTGLILLLLALLLAGLTIRAGVAVRERFSGRDSAV